jgi:hypothetical protein
MMSKDDDMYAPRVLRALFVGSDESIRQKRSDHKKSTKSSSSQKGKYPNKALLIETLATTTFPRDGAEAGLSRKVPVMKSTTQSTMLDMRDLPDSYAPEDIKRIMLEADVVVLVFSILCPESLDRLRTVYMPIVHAIGCPWCLVCTEMEMISSTYVREVIKAKVVAETKALRRLCNQYNGLRLFEVSAPSGFNVPQLLEFTMAVAQGKPPPPDGSRGNCTIL